jgi:hypothetical protein
MPPSLLQDGGRKAAELRELTGRFSSPAGNFPLKFLKNPGDASPGLEDCRHD